MNHSGIPVGVSACLAGQAVRFNGQHKRSSFGTASELEAYFSFVPMCPEVAAGMGVPRKPVRLVESSDTISVIQLNEEAADLTAPLIQASDRLAEQAKGLYGFVVMQKSPSCGARSVKLYNPKGGVLSSKRDGVFVEALRKRCPLMPIEEAGRLNDDILRENFLLRVWAYHESCQLLAESFSIKALLDLHARYKYLVMAHNPARLKAMGQLLAAYQRGDDLVELGTRWQSLLMQALSRPSTRKQHANVLEHIRGYLKRFLNASEKASLNQIIQQYREGVLPLVAPMTLLRHYFRVFHVPYMHRQAYLQPYPDTLSLMNHK